MTPLLTWQRVHDIGLLQKDLLVLEHGVEEGHQNFGNTIKYIRQPQTNFGNVLSVGSSFFPPRILANERASAAFLLGLAYTVTCIAIPRDNVDDSFLSASLLGCTFNYKLYALDWTYQVQSLMYDLALMFFVVSPALPEEPGQNAAAGNTAAQALFILSFKQVGSSVQ